MDEKNFFKYLTTKAQVFLALIVKYKLLLSFAIPFFYIMTLKSTLGKVDFFDNLFVDGVSLTLLTGSTIMLCVAFLSFYYIFSGFLIVSLGTPKFDESVLYSIKGLSEIPAVSFLTCLMTYQLTLVEAKWGIFSGSGELLLVVPFFIYAFVFISLKYILRYCEVWFSYTSKHKRFEGKPLISMSFIITMVAYSYLIMSLMYFNKHDGTWTWRGYSLFLIAMLCQHVPAFACFSMKMKKHSNKELLKTFFISSSVVLVFVFYFSPSLFLRVIPLSLNVAGRADWNVKEYRVKSGAFEQSDFGGRYWGADNFKSDGRYLNVTGVVLFKSKDKFVLCPQRIKNYMDILFKVSFIWQDIKEKAKANDYFRKIIMTCPSVPRESIFERID